MKINFEALSKELRAAGFVSPRGDDDGGIVFNGVPIWGNEYTFTIGRYNPIAWEAFDIIAKHIRAAQAGEGPTE